MLKKQKDLESEKEKKLKNYEQELTQLKQQKELVAKSLAEQKQATETQNKQATDKLLAEHEQLRA